VIVPSVVVVRGGDAGVGARQGEDGEGRGQEQQDAKEEVHGGLSSSCGWLTWVSSCVVESRKKEGEDLYMGRHCAIWAGGD
jgi:hypothetical protein